MKENSPDIFIQTDPLASVDYAVDELNLAEFPLSAISDRFLNGTKTVVLEDTVFDKEENRYLPRRLTLSGSDRYGLPTSMDDDVLLACIQLSRLNDFSTRDVHFSRYEILRMLGWSDETRNYERVATSLRRWKGLSIYSDRAFYDHQAKSWVNRDFGVFDDLVIYRRESMRGKTVPATSRFTWNEVLLRSFQSGYLKQLDWNLYCRMTSPVAKRLYRFLDKRFYHGNSVEIDLRELSQRKVRFAADYTTAQMKRALSKGIEELEQLWELKPRPHSERYRKDGQKWIAIFERRGKPPRKLVQPKIEEIALKQTSMVPLNAIDPSTLARELTKRGLGPASAEELCALHPANLIQERLELFDWYNQRGQVREAGFLVNSIRNSSTIVMPRGFESSGQRKERQRAIEAQKQAESNVRTKREREAVRQELSRQRAFTAFWERMSPSEQDTFETEALEQADVLKRDQYLEHLGKGGKIFELYRLIVLKDHFERIHTLRAIPKQVNDG